MAKCGYCNSTIIFGGVNAGAYKFCNATCHQNAYILSVTKTIPEDVVSRRVEEVWRGNCPKCSCMGPVDIHYVYEVWSAFVITRWTTSSQVSCHGCARKRQLGGIAFSLALGWWGFPWGLVLTPVQVTRNIIGMCGGPGVARPSENLRNFVLVSMGTQMIAAQKSAAVPPVIKPVR